MLAQMRLWLAPLFLLSLAACGGSSSTPDSGIGPDAGPAPDASLAPYTIRLSRSAGGTVTSAVACEPSCAATGDQTFTAVADAGWTFIGWSGDCTGTGACTVHPGADR